MWDLTEAFRLTFNILSPEHEDSCCYDECHEGEEDEAYPAEDANGVASRSVLLGIAGQARDEGSGVGRALHVHCVGLHEELLLHVVVAVAGGGTGAVGDRGEADGVVGGGGLQRLTEYHCDGGGLFDGVHHSDHHLLLHSVADVNGLCDGLRPYGRAATRGAAACAQGNRC